MWLITNIVIIILHFFFQLLLGRVADLGPDVVVRLGGPPVLLCEADRISSFDLEEPPPPMLSFIMEAL